MVSATVLASGASPIAIAHRGAPEYAPENTMSSFSIAAAQGADAIECDIWLTADCRLAVNHDPTTGRVWSRDLEIEKTDMDTLSSLSPNAGFAAAFPRFRKEKIPVFSDVLAAFPDKMIFAELKSDSAKACDMLAEAIIQANAVDRVTVISFSRETIERLTENGYCCAWLASPESPAEVRALNIPKGAAVDIPCGSVNAETVEYLHNLGIKVYCYTSSGEVDFTALSKTGIDGITSDNLSFLKNAG